MADSDAVLQINAAFYAAFATADMDAMMAVWTRDAPVAVIHPGTLPVVGRDPVQESWREILTPAREIDIACVDPTVQIHGDTAIVLCHERINGHLLAASNTYRRVSEGWLLVMHQAGAVAAIVGSARSSVVH
ncbi:MAG: nuclear transport factor 2 family protein [Alphaproteobacteria bacterium]|nr:nuclear transport factor 2 family protein [Alphaproteobacteria bacterium]